MANGMRDVNATHGTRAAVVKAAKAVQAINKADAFCFFGEVRQVAIQRLDPSRT